MVTGAKRQVPYALFWHERGWRTGRFELMSSIGHLIGVEGHGDMSVSIDGAPFLSVEWRWHFRWQRFLNLSIRDASFHCSDSRRIGRLVLPATHWSRIVYADWEDESGKVPVLSQWEPGAIQFRRSDEVPAVSFRRGALSNAKNATFDSLLRDEPIDGGRIFPDHASETLDERLHPALSLLLATWTPTWDQL
jgi:hypothetical protein